MVIVKGSFPVKRRLRDQALELVKSFAATTRDEMGCLAYEVYCNADAPATIVIWQQWRSTATLDDHFSSDSMESFLERLSQLLDGEVDTLYFDVETDEGKESPASTLSQASVAEGVTIH